MQDTGDRGAALACFETIWATAFRFSASSEAAGSSSSSLRTTMHVIVTMRTHWYASTMTSNHRSTPGTMLERGAGVAVWRRIERILAAGIAYAATRFANVPELLPRTGSITKSMAGFNIINYLRKRSRTGGG
jgi:CubicO group peptidase (beta-lactamase class C family)